MPRVVQKHVREKLEAWAKLEKKIVRLKVKRDKALAPFLKTLNEDSAPALAEYDKKSVAPVKKAAALKKEILAKITADTDKEGNPKPISIESDNAVASVSEKEGSRIVNPKKFFEFVKTKNDAFWKSVKIIIKDATVVIGEKEIDDLSDKPITFPTEVKLKNKK